MVVQTKGESGHEYMMYGAVKGGAGVGGKSLFSGGLG